MRERKQSTLGLSMKEALKLVEELGGEVQEVHGSPEAKVRLPGYERSCKISTTRKDAPRVLAVRLGKMLRERERAEKVDEAWVTEEPAAVEPESAPEPVPAIPAAVLQIQENQIASISAALARLEAKLAEQKNGGAAQSVDTSYVQSRITGLQADQEAMLDMVVKLSDRVQRLENIIVHGVQALFEERKNVASS